MSLAILPSLFGLAPERKAVDQKRPLSILSCQSDAVSELHQAVVYILTTHLSGRRAEGSCISNVEQMARLLSTQPMAVAILSRARAIALDPEEPALQALGCRPLRTLISLNDYLLVGRADLPETDAYQITATLSLNYTKFAHIVEASSAAFSTSPLLPLHPGTRAYYEGRPCPEASLNFPASYHQRFQPV